METAEHKSQMESMGLVQRYMDAAEFAAYWDEVEIMFEPLVEAGRKEE